MRTEKNKKDKRRYEGGNRIESTEQKHKDRQITGMIHDE